MVRTLIVESKCFFKKFGRNSKCDRDLNKRPKRKGKIKVLRKKGIKIQKNMESRCDEKLFQHYSIIYEPGGGGGGALAIPTGCLG